MPINGSGTVSKRAASVAVPNTTVQSSPYNLQEDDTVDSLNAMVQLTGLKTMTGNLPFGGFKATGLGDGTAAQDAATTKQVQTSVVQHSTAVAGTADAIQVTLSPVSTTLTTNEIIRWKSGGANTVTGPTLSKDGGSTNKTIKKGTSVALAVGDTGASGYECEATYNGTDWILKNPAAVAFAGGAINIQTFTTSDTWTKPVRGTIAVVYIVGGGGSGGKGAAAAAQGGGGGGGYAEKTFLLSTLGATETVTLGDGGAAQTTANTAGNAGGDSTFGAWLTAYGGGGGGFLAGGGGGGGAGGGFAGAGLTAVGGTGGSAQGLGGGNGGATGTIGGISNGGGGGGGGAATDATTANGNGGASASGGGGGGAGAEDSSPGAGTGGFALRSGGNGGAGGFDTNVATSGTQPGGGGGGSEEGNSGAGAKGGCTVYVY